MSETNVVTNFIAGGVGGSCAVITGHPFDTVKVRLQTMPRPALGQRPMFTGAFDCVRQTVSREGFFALYKGMAAPLVGVSPLFAVFFGGTAVGKWMLQKEPGQKLTFLQNFTAGAVAGVFTTAVMVPGERIKCILQVQSMGSTNEMPKYNGPLDVVRKLYKEGGIRSLYRGTAATLLRDIPASGAYISVYELLKDKFSGGERQKLTPMATLMAGGFAGIANWSVCIPADVMKSRLQTAPEGKYPRGIRDVFREILREEGPRALFRGFVPVMLRAFPANAACFSGLELALWAFREAGI
uniref:Mitochondrial carnitine/acylcarnitine carrier protein n=1 Tax=Globodera pallida TaxID=36090 RepID=A0A183BPH6_GLOPA